jgi:hypothetical protein
LFRTLTLPILPQTLSYARKSRQVFIDFFALTNYLFQPFHVILGSIRAHPGV